MPACRQNSSGLDVHLHIFPFFHNVFCGFTVLDPKSNIKQRSQVAFTPIATTLHTTSKLFALHHVQHQGLWRYSIEPSRRKQASCPSLKCSRSAVSLRRAFSAFGVNIRRQNLSIGLSGDRGSGCRVWCERSRRLIHCNEHSANWPQVA